jgi:glycosyltransferase involved in cell wall biosynthesis
MVEMIPAITAAKNMDAGSSGSTQNVPAVSVVVPCYNGSKYLDAMMASLARQTFRDFEVVIVDDGSDDDTTVSKLAALNRHARVIHQANRGPSAARNAGIRAARADIVFVLDCDDMIEPAFLAETVPAMRGAPADVGMVFTDVLMVGRATGVVPRYFNRFDLLFTNTMSSGLVFRKQCWSAAGGYDETMREGYEDWDFSLRLADAGYRGLEIAKPLYIYHIGANEIQQSRSSDVHVKRLYGKLWRDIRCKHPLSYRPLAILRLWLATRDGSGRIPLWKGLTAYALALLLPDAWFSRLFAILHRRHRQEGPAEAYTGVSGHQPRLAP